MARPKKAAAEKKAVAERSAASEKQALAAPVRKSAKTASTNSAAPRRKGAREASAHRSEPTVTVNIEFDPSQHRQEIAETAYYLWERRGGYGGSAEDDWREAEAIVRRKYSQPSEAVRAAGSGRG